MKILINNNMPNCVLIWKKLAAKWNNRYDWQ